MRKSAMYHSVELSILGHHGVPVPHTFYRQDDDTEHLAMILPGLGYSCDMPLWTRRRRRNRPKRLWSAESVGSIRLFIGQPSSTRCSLIQSLEGVHRARRARPRPRLRG